MKHCLDFVKPVSGLHVTPSRSGGFIVLILALLASLSVSYGTSVVAPSFGELVAESQVIVRAKVREVRCAWVDSTQGRVIKTFVTLEVLKRLKGETADELTLQFLGGELDGQSMLVAGIPRFVVGRTEVVFVSGNGRRFCPIVAMMHGRYRVQTEAATRREYVARDDGVPLESEHDVQLPQGGNLAANRLKSVAAALSAEDFEKKISEEVAVNATKP